jgi:hypothetical protein
LLIYKSRVKNTKANYSAVSMWERMWGEEKFLFAVFREVSCSCFIFHNKFFSANTETGIWDNWVNSCILDMQRRLTSTCNKLCTFQSYIETLFVKSFFTVLKLKPTTASQICGVRTVRDSLCSKNLLNENINTQIHGCWIVVNYAAFKNSWMTIATCL